MSAFSPSFFFARFLTGRCPETGRLPIRMSQCRSSSGHKEARHVCPLQIQKPDFTLKPSGIPCQTSVTAHYAMARYNDRHRIIRHAPPTACADMLRIPRFRAISKAKSR